MKQVTIKIGLVPARTGVALMVPIDESLCIHPEDAKKLYCCLDCGYRTFILDDMLGHQAEQRQHHTLWQRIRRFFRWR